jgi:hypothetical protein
MAHVRLTTNRGRHDVRDVLTVIFSFSLESLNGFFFFNIITEWVVDLSDCSTNLFRKTLGKIVNLINYLVPVVFETFGAGDEDGPPRPNDILLLIGLRAEKLLPRPAGHTGDEQEQLHSNYR